MYIVRLIVPANSSLVLWGNSLRLERKRGSKYGGSKLSVVCGPKMIVFCVGIDWLGFCVGCQNWLGVCARPKSDLALLCASKSTWFLCRHRNWIGFYVWAAENNLILVRVSIDLIFVWVVEIDLVFCVRAENDLVLGWASKLLLCRWSKLTWCQCGGSKLFYFQWRDRHWLGFGVGVENAFVVVYGSKLTWF